MITYDNITLVPDQVSQQMHRNGDTSIFFCGVTLDIPIIASPMPDVCNGEMADALAQSGALGIIHRFQTIKEQVGQYRDAAYINTYKENKVSCAIGVSGDYQERFQALYEAGCQIFCLDTANGANNLVKEAAIWIRTQTRQRIDIFLIAGNVATEVGYKFLADLKAIDAVRVGIASGNVCNTRTETGVYLPTLESVLRCAKAKKTYYNAPLIIADGGIRTPADMAKALAVGADIVMAGRIFAGYKETPGDTLKIKGEKFKLYRGAASHSVQKEFTGEKPKNNEGEETLVPYVDESVSKILSRFKTGLQSSMSYMNASNLTEFHQNVSWERL
jgi:IMP dehydrogenase